VTRGAIAGLAGLVAVALVAAWWTWRATPADPAVAPDRPASRSAAAGEPAAIAPPGRRPSAERHEPLPPSLRGTEVDGALVVDASGRFVPTPDAIDLFDYFLAAEGEESPEQLHARIVAAIRARLDGEAAADAEALLADYLDYRAQAAALFEGDADAVALERRLQQVRELQRGVFGADVAAALFGAEEERWFVELERQRILADEGLDPAERDRRLARLDADVPEELRHVREAALAPSSLRAEEERLRAAGAGAAEIEALRTQRFGADAAERLSVLDAERAAWQERVTAYRAERDERLANAPPAERDALLGEIRARHFDTAEQLRIRSLDRIEAPPAP